MAKGQDVMLTWMIYVWAVLIVAFVALDVYYLVLIGRLKRAGAAFEREGAAHRMKLTRDVESLLREFYADPLNPKWHEDATNEPTVLH